MTIVNANQHDTLSYALAYIERYPGNVPQLEKERECLLAALAQAWHQEQYRHIVRLTAALAYLVGRPGDYKEGERILLRGIHACRQIQDQLHLAHFLNRLGGLLCSHGQFAQARQVWQESVEIANALGQPAYLWEPLSSFVHIADILGRYDAVCRFTESLLHRQRAVEQSALAAALFIRGFYARIAGELERAYDDFTACLHLLSTQKLGMSSYECFFEMELRTEFARLEGDYAGSRDYTEAAVSLAHIFCDLYTVAVLLWDQACFAYRQGMLIDAQSLVQRMLLVAAKMEASHICAWGTNLQSYLLPQLAKSLEQAQALEERLSARELDVLRLVAAGLSNQEIAARLVITTATVKKHLEHIYGKLDAHSRTQALAQASVLKLL